VTSSGRRRQRKAEGVASLASLPLDWSEHAECFS